MTESVTQDPDTFVFEAIGTRWAIETPHSMDLPLRQSIRARTEAFDVVWSRFRGDSLVSKVGRARSGGCFHFPEEAVRLFDFYDHLHAVTAGAVDPLVGRDLEILGYDQDYSLVPSRSPGRAAHPLPRWASDVLRQGSILRSYEPLVIDVGAAGKGLLVDLVSALLHDAGHRDHLIDASGDLLRTGDCSLAIGLEDPRNEGHVIGVANLRSGALCASASNRRRWGNGLHHILNARTGLPVHDVTATWVLADTAMIADGLATALFFVEPASLASTYRFQFVKMYSDGRAEWSSDLDGQIFV